MSRREVRETALQVLFQIDVGSIDPEFALANSIERTDLQDQADISFLNQLVYGVLDKQSKIDRIICDTSLGWELDRIANVDRNILRLAIYELFYIDDIPARVSINEAIELGKCFGSEDSGKFINGILGKVIPQKESGY